LNKLKAGLTLGNRRKNMKKAGYITALVAVILDTLVTIFTVNLLSQFNSDFALTILVLTLLLLVPMIVALFLVNKNKLWAIAFVVVGAISFIMNVNSGNSIIPLIPTAQIVAGILILLSKEELKDIANNIGGENNDQPK
jgi:Na+/pantothenate symporter